MVPGRRTIPRLWIAYVDAERTLQGFETFLDQYRALLASLPSGVMYVAPTVWHGVIQTAFTKALSSRDGAHHEPLLGRTASCGATIEDARFERRRDTGSTRRFREQCAEFTHAGIRRAVPALARDVQHRRARTSTRRGVPAVPSRVHALGRRYDPGRDARRLR